MINKNIKGMEETLNKNFFKASPRSGFTLIELLVVVLIIGVLTAIALPQYEVVVEKSRASEAMVNAKAIQDAMQRHEQEFPGDSTTNCTKIADVQLQGGTWNTGDLACRSIHDFVFTTKNFNFDLTGNNSCVGAGTNSNYFTICRRGTNGSLYVIHYPRTPGSRPVAVSGCDGDYEQVCKLFTNI